MCKKNLDDLMVKEIIKSINKIKFGEVLIVIHNNNIVQIECKEKKRFERIK